MSALEIWGVASFCARACFLVICKLQDRRRGGAALFLSRFQAQQLAYAQISSSVLVAVVIAGYVLICATVLLAICSLAACIFSPPPVRCFWGLAHYYSRLSGFFLRFMYG